jgi:hypothetical protein
LATKYVFAQHPVIALNLQNFKCAEVILSIPPLFFSPTFLHFSQIQLAVASKNFATLVHEVDACRTLTKQNPNQIILFSNTWQGAAHEECSSQRLCSAAAQLSVNGPNGRLSSPTTLAVTLKWSLHPHDVLPVKAWQTAGLASITGPPASSSTKQDGP